MEFAGLLGVGRRKEKLKLERNKNFFFTYYISLAHIWVMGPPALGALGRCPSCPGPGPGLSLLFHDFPLHRDH